MSDRLARARRHARRFLCAFRAAAGLPPVDPRDELLRAALAIEACGARAVRLGDRAARLATLSAALVASHDALQREAHKLEHDSRAAIAAACAAARAGNLQDTDGAEVLAAIGHLQDQLRLFTAAVKGDRK